MWSGLLSIGRTAERTWAMATPSMSPRTAVEHGFTASASSRSTTATDGVAMTIDSIIVARSTGDPHVLLETLTIGALHLAAIGSHPDTVRALNAERATGRGRGWPVARRHGARARGSRHVRRRRPRVVDGSTARGHHCVPRARRRWNSGAVRDQPQRGGRARGDMAGAAAAMAMALAVGYEAGFGSATIRRAVLCWLRGRNGEIEEALTLGREVVALAHQPFNPVIRAQALFALGVAETLAGHTSDADTHLSEALLIHERVGMKRETAMDHRHIGHLRFLEGDVDAAIVHHHRAVRWRSRSVCRGR